MKRFFLAALIVLLAAVTLVAAIEYDPGYLLLSYGRYTLETSIWVGLLVFVVLFVLVYLVFSLLRRTVSGGNAVSSWFRGRGYRRSQQQTTQGLIAFIEGRWQIARRMLSKAAVKSETPLLNYLVAARASHALGDAQQVKEFLKKAEESTSGAIVAVGITQAEMQLKSGRYEQGLATLMRVRRNVSKHPYVLDLLKKAYVGLNDWQEVLALLPDLKKHKVLSVEELEALELRAGQHSILDAAKVRGDVEAELNALWQRLPANVTKNSEAVALYAEQILAAGNAVTAEKIIRNQLKKDWNKKLINLYGRVEGEDTGKQLLYAENWLQERNNDAALLLCLGRLSLRNSLWGKAREYFEISLKLEQNSEVCAELGRLLAQLGEHEKSNEYFQRGLMLATNNLPELPLPEKKTTIAIQ